MRSPAAAVLLGLVMPACGSGDDSCGVCTSILIAVGVDVVDATGQLVPRMTTKTVELPTGDVVHLSTTQNDTGHYILLTDLDSLDPSRGERHELRFYAHSVQGTAMGDFVVRAGGCVCHVEKLSGPGELVLQPFPPGPDPEPTPEPPTRETDAPQPSTTAPAAVPGTE